MARRTRPTSADSKTSDKEKKMIIEKIDIKSFGGLSDVSLEFGESINVIEGRNEAGKSTIAAFIRYMLFGFGAAEESGALSERKKRISWTSGVAEGSMVIRVKDKRYLINRSTVPLTDAAGRESYKEDCAIIDLETGTSSFGKLPAGEVFFGTTKDLFENTAFLGQIGDSSINEGSVSESIENILFSGNERMNTQRAISKVGEKIDGLMHRSGSGGVIADLKRRRTELEINLERSNEDNKQILAKETELHSIRHERKEAQSRLERLRDLDDCYKNVMLIQTFDQLHALEEDSVAKQEAYNAFIAENTRAGYVPTEEYLTDIALTRRAVADTYRALLEAEDGYEREKNAIGITHEIENMIALSDTMGKEHKVIERAKAHRTGSVRNISLGLLAFLVAVAAGVYQIVAAGAIAAVAWRVVFGVLGVAALGGAAVLTHFALRDNKTVAELAQRFEVGSYKDLLGKLVLIAEARAKRDGLARSTELAKAHLDKCRAEYDAAKADLTRVIVRWGEEPPASGLEAFLDKLAAKASAFLERKSILLEEKNSVELTVREIRRNLSDKSEVDIRALVSPMRRKVLAGINHDDIISGIAALRTRISECEREEFSVESELISLRARAGDPNDVYTKLDILNEQISELERRHEAYTVALEAIEAATDNLREGVSPRLGEYATDIMSIMTDKKYDSFSVTGKMKVSFKNVTDEESRSVDFLSGGTRDLAYFAVRMALIDMLYPEKPPICFDETFAHQDNVRARSMMSAISKLADEGYQSFIFTCRAREGMLASELAKGANVYKLSLSEDDIA